MNTIFVDLLMALLLLVTVAVVLLLLVFGRKEEMAETKECFEVTSLAQKVKDIINEIINQDVAILNLNETESRKREEQKKY